MTQEEIDALPESGGIGYRVEVRDGREVRIPFVMDAFALGHEPGDPVSVVDSRGVGWLLGRVDGVLYKRRTSW